MVQADDGQGHTCAVRSDGSVWCWGRNRNGQLGDGTATRHLTPVQVKGLTGVIQVAAGYEDTCAVRSDGTVWCWGDNGEGEIGDGTHNAALTPVEVPGLTGVRQVSAGWWFNCALRTDGTVWCWGEIVPSLVPVQVTGLSGVVAQVAAGEGHVCARLESGAVLCWGWNAFGQLGDGTTVSRSQPAPVVGLPGPVTWIKAGAGHTCVRRADGTVWCWGYNGVGQLGDGTLTERLTATRSLVTGAVAVNVGTGDLYNGFTCARTHAKTVTCWGAGSFGQLGDGTTTTSRATPARVRSLTGVSSLALGFTHACAVLTNGTMRCWGDNAYGQLGDGTRTQRSTPVTVLS